MRLGVRRTPRRLWPRLAVAGLVLVAAAASALPAAAGPAPIAGVSLAAPTVGPVVLPRDHGAHPGFEVEWWYTAGTVTDSRGSRYFWFATVWSGVQGLVARVNVVDLRRDRVVLSREYASPGQLAAGSTRMRITGFSFGRRPIGALGRWYVNARAPGGRLSLDLVPRRPYVLNGHDGIIQQGPGGPSAYYSEPRLAARGFLELHGRRLPVDGQGWLDHQWGNFIANVGSLRWDWFACQFRDGRDLMLYQFLDAHDRPSSLRAGTLVQRDNHVEHLTHFTAVALAPFVRPAGALASYPQRWRLEVPALHSVVTLRSLARNQFVRNRFVPSFWEGAAAITSGAPGTCIVESSREVAASP